MLTPSALICKVTGRWPRSRVVALLAIAIAGWGGVAATPAPQPRRLVVTISGDRVQYRDEMKAAEIVGNVRIYLEIEGELDQRAIIRADRAAANLQSGQIEAQNGITVGTPQGVVTGEYLRFNARSGEFSLKDARSVVNVNPGAPQAEMVHGYLFGEEIAREKQLVYIIQGAITTCNRAHPHYVLRAKRIEYYPDQQRFKVKGASISLYGVKIPLVPSFSFSVSEKERETPGILPVPGYSSEDKLYLPYRFRFSSSDSPWRSDLSLRLTQGRGIRLLSANKYTKGRWQAAGYLSQTEDFYDDLGNYLTLDRRPELTFTKFAASPDQDEGWRGSVSLANIVEDRGRDTRANSTPRVAQVLNLRRGDQRGWRTPPTGQGFIASGPKIREQYAALTFRYDRHTDQRRRKQGQWYGLSARQAFYSTGDNYRDLAFTAGAGGPLAPDLTGSLTLTHHITGGRTPFLSDTVNIKTELQPTLAAQLSRRWAIQGMGRYDANDGKLRDYELELRRRAHCLTWGLYYHFVGERIGIRVDINGLTGDTAPPARRSDLDRLYQKTQDELAAGATEQ